jgi:hypothetical protein
MTLHHNRPSILMVLTSFRLGLTLTEFLLPRVRLDLFKRLNVNMNCYILDTWLSGRLFDSLLFLGSFSFMKTLRY